MTVAHAKRPFAKTERHHSRSCRVETPRVLLIEDHQRLRETLCASLTANGCEVVSASSGARGFLEFLRREPDLVVLDVQLPDMDGLHVLGEIRQRSTAVPVVIMTTKMAPVYSAIPSVSVLRKPFQPHQFLREVGRALGDPSWLLGFAE
jgi:DNA-binding response OmpR family regulator